MPEQAEGRPAKPGGLRWIVRQALRRRRVYQTATAPPATSRAPSAAVVPIGAPVSGSVLPLLTPPPGVGAEVVGLTLPPGGTVSALPVGVGDVAGLSPP